MILQIDTLLLDQLSSFGNFAFSATILFFFVRYFMSENKKLVAEVLKNGREDTAVLMKTLDKSSDALAAVALSMSKMGEGLIRLSAGTDSISKAIDEQTKEIERAQNGRK
jgi:hypothetical protein